MSAQLQFSAHAFNLEILAFVLMPNHFHLILKTPYSNLDKAMAWFMRETSRQLVKHSGRINQTYGARHYRSLIKTHHYFLHAYKYLYLNPIRAGLACRVEEYSYSTLPGLLGLRHMSIPIVEDLTLFSDVEGTIRWLNQIPEDGEWETIRKALRRKEFTLPKVRGKTHPLEFNAL